MYTVDALTAHAEANGISLFACGGVLAGEQCLTGLPVQNDARVIDSIHKLAVENNIHPLVDSLCDDSHDMPVPRPWRDFLGRSVVILSRSDIIS